MGILDASASAADVALALDEPRTARLKATFNRRLEWNEQIDVAERFILLQGSTQVPASANWDPYDQEVTLTPTNPLSYHTTYSIGIEGLTQGNVQSITNTSFTTAVRGDVNGDGFTDALVGSMWADGGGTDKGAAYVFLGSSSGIADCDIAAGGIPAATIIGATDNDFLGSSVSMGFDLNRDGYDDILVGANGADGGGTNRGRAYTFRGSVSGIANCNLGGTCTASWMVTGASDDDQLGNVR